jgi:hypothetical protein
MAQENPVMDLKIASLPEPAILTCSDLQKYYHDALVGPNNCHSMYDSSMRVEAQNGSQIKTSQDAASTMSGSSNILGNQRVAGIDEADFTKVSDHHIFVASGDQIVVLDRKMKSYLGKIEIEAQKNAFGLSDMAPQGSHPNLELLTYEDKLFVLREKTVSVYHLKEGLVPEFKEKLDLIGRISTARISGQRLLLVSYIEVPWKGSSQDSDWKQGLDCSQVYIGRGRPQNLITLVSSHDVDNIGAKEEHLFASKLELYLTQNYITLYENTGVSTDIRRIRIEKDGSLGRVKSASVEGSVKDVWALSELGEDGSFLSIATTAMTNEIMPSSPAVGPQPLGGRGTILTNHLTVLADLNGDLSAVGAVKNFGLGEDIRSARKVGDLVYIVTFKKTDPLFAIDVSNPEDPKILSELKIPGFSTYMHPISDSKLIGLGFDAADMGSYALYQGIQVSLFDTSNSRDVIRTDVKILGSRGSSSIATVDHRAFFMDQEEALFGFPLTEIGPNFSQSFGKQVSDFFTGAVIYRVSGNALVEANRISHRSFISPDSLMNLGSLYSWWQTPAMNQDIERLFKVDGNLVSVSKSGLKSYDYTRLEELTSVRWDKGSVSQAVYCGVE